MLTAFSRDLRHRAMRPLDGVEDEQPVVFGAPCLCADASPVVADLGRLDEPAAPLGVVQATRCSASGSARNSFQTGSLVERQLGPEREQRAERAAVDLREHPPARRRRFVEQGEVLAPDVGHAAPAEYAERDRPSTLYGELAQADVIVAQAGVVGSAVHPFPRELHDPCVQVTHHADEPPHFVPTRLCGWRPGDPPESRGSAIARW